MKKELEAIKLDDNKDYIIVDEINEYIYLANVENEKDFCIRKKIDKFLIGLDNEEEFNDALMLFTNKNIN